MITPKYYRVVIDGTSYDANSAPNDGFIDNTSAIYYDPRPTTLVTALAKKRANMRYRELVQKLSEEVNPLYIIDIVATDADGDDPATSFEFTVAYQDVESLSTRDELNPGVVLNDVNTIKRFTARSMLSHFIRTENYFDPTGYNPLNMAYIEKEEHVEMGALETMLTAAEANITVTNIPNT